MASDITGRAIAIASNLAQSTGYVTDHNHPGFQQLVAQWEQLLASGDQNAMQAELAKWKANPHFKGFPQDPTPLMSGVTGGDGPIADSKASASDLLREFAQYMMAPLDMNDPYVQSVVRGASGAAGTDARNRGLQGGMAVGNTERAVSGALTAAQLQRNQLGANALGQAGQLDLGQANLQLQAYNNQYQAQMGELAARQQNGQAIGAVLGTVAGAVGSYYGVPGLNPQSGAQMGGGLGGLATGGARMPSYVPPSSIGLNKRGGV